MRRVAAILNCNAQGVSAARIANVRELLGDAHVFVTRSLGESRAAAEAIVASSYDVVCTGGGDGTFVQAIADLRGAGGAMPILFGLRLGTGNAIADVCGARRASRAGLAADLARASSDEPPGSLRLLDVDGALAHSAGAGLDAEFNLDLAAVHKASLRRAPWLRPVFAGVPGLIATAVVRTAPHLALRRPARMSIHALGPATRIDRRGNPLAELPDGALLHDGGTTLVTASTCTTFGRGVVLFPATDRRSDRFQIRIAQVGLVGALRELFAVVRGAASTVAGIDDFLVGGIRIELADRTPAHVGGEVRWPGRTLSITLARERVSILRKPVPPPS